MKFWKIKDSNSIPSKLRTVLIIHHSQCIDSIQKKEEKLNEIWNKNKKRKEKS